MTTAAWEHHAVDAQRMAVEYVRREAGRVAGTALAQAARRGGIVRLSTLRELERRGLLRKKANGADMTWILDQPG